MIASASLEPGTWWDCFCFCVRTKDASTALLCGQRRCCWKEYRYLTHGWLFRHSLWIHQGIHQIPRRYGNSLPQYIMPTWKCHLKVQRRSYDRRELFEQGSFHRWCKLTVAISLLLTIHFVSSCRTSVDLLVFFSVPSQLPSDHGNGPSGWVSTDFLSNFLLVAMSTIWPNNLWSAFRTVSLF